MSGHCYYDLENYDEALNCYLEVKKLCPEEIENYYNLGETYRIKNKHKIALGYYETFY